MTDLFITVALLLGNALFVAGEFALIAVRRTALEPAAAAGSRRARLALSAMNQVPLMIAGAQLGVTVCSLGLGAIAEPALAALFAQPFRHAGLPDEAVHAVAFPLALLVVVFAHTVIGEMVPKNLTLAGPKLAVLWLGPLMLGFCTATKPLLVAMRWLAQQTLRIWRIEPTDAVKTVFTAEELAGLVAESRTEGLLDNEEHARISGALALAHRSVHEVVEPWRNVITVRDDITAEQLEQLAHRTGRSRFPVISPDAGTGVARVIGFVHIKDVIGLGGAQRESPLPARVVRPIPVIAPDRRLADVLLTMRRERKHLMIVRGGAQPLGVVSLDDVLRAVVGGEPNTRTVIR